MNDLNIREMANLMNNPGNVKDLLLKEHPDTDHSPAEFFADVITILRADQARIARAAGVELKAKPMSDERAAELMAALADPNESGVELFEMFNREAERRDEIIREMLDAEDYERFMDAKLTRLYTSDSAERPNED